MNDEIKEINITYPGQILDYVDTKEHLLELFNYITNLQEENKQTKLLKERYQLEKEVYKSRIEKAIEYIESYNLPQDLGSLSECPISVADLKELLKILRGENIDE